jgi:hypothetical protein
MDLSLSLSFDFSFGSIFVWWLSEASCSCRANLLTDLGALSCPRRAACHYSGRQLRASPYYYYLV